MTVAHKVILRQLGVSSDLDDSKLRATGACAIAPGNAVILAYSVFKPDASVDRIISASDGGRMLLSDQKQPFEQFQPKRLVTSVSCNCWI